MKVQNGCENERVIERIHGISLERGLQGRLEPIRRSAIVEHFLDGERVGIHSGYRVGSFRFGWGGLRPVGSVRLAESRRRTDGSGSPFWMEPAIALRTRSRNRSRSAGSTIR